MALQPNEIIDLAGLQTGIQNVRKEISEFGRDTQGVIAILNRSITDSKAQLQALIDTLKSVNTSNPQAGNQMANASQQATQLANSYQVLLNSQNQLTNAGQLARATLNDLITAQKELAKQVKEVITEENKDEQATKNLLEAYKSLSSQVNQLSNGLKENKKATKDAVGSYNELQKSLSDDIKILKSLGGAFDTSTGSIKANDNVTKELINRIRAKQEALKDVDKQMGINTRNVGNYESALNVLNGGVSGILGSLGIFGATMIALGSAYNDVLVPLAKMNDEFNKMDILLKATSSSEAQYGANKSMLINLSNEYGLSLIELNSAYKDLAGNTVNTNFEGQKTQQIFTSIIKASAGLKLSSEDTAGAIRAIGQMLSKGTVNAEELKGQLGDRLPGAMRLLSEVTGKTTTELIKMMEKGELMAKDIVPKLSEAYEKAFGKNASDNINTYAGATERLRTQWSLFASTNFGFISNGIAKVKNAFSDFFETLNKRAKFQDGFWDRFLGNSIIYSKLTGSISEQTLQYQMKIDDDFAKFSNMSRESQLKQINSHAKEIDRLNRDIANTTSSKEKAELQKRRDTLVEYQHNEVKLYEDEYKRRVSLQKEANDRISEQSKKDAEKALKQAQKDHEKYITEQKARYQNELRTIQAQEKEKLYELETNRVKGLISEEEYAKERLKIRLDFNERELSLASNFSNKDKEIAKTLEDDKARFNADKKQAQLESTKIHYDSLKKLLSDYLEEEQNAFVQANRNYENELAQRMDIIDADTASKISMIKKPQGKGKLGKVTESQNVEYDIAKTMVEVEGLANKINAIGVERVKITNEINNAYQEAEFKIMSSMENSEIKAKKLDEAKAQRDIALKNQKIKTETDYQEYLKQLKQKESELEQEQANKQIAIIKEKEEKKREQIENTYNLINQLSSSAFEILKGNRDAELSMLQGQKEYEMKLAGDNAEAKIQAEQKYDQKIREIKRKQAIADKAQAIFNIALNAAQAMTKVSAQTGTLTFIFSPLVAALSALQLATVLGTPIPEFKKGKKRGDSYEGLGIVGEAGAEIVERNGQQQIVSKPTLTYLDRDTTVYTPYETQRMLKDMDKVSNINKYSRMIDMNNSFSRKTEVSKQTQMQLALRQMSFNEKTITSAIHEGFSDINLWLNNQDGSLTRKRGNSTVKDITNRTIYYK